MLRTAELHLRIASALLTCISRDKDLVWARMSFMGSMGCVPDLHCVVIAVVFADPAKYAGKVVPVARERLSWPEAAQMLSEVTGIPVRCAC